MNHDILIYVPLAEEFAEVSKHYVIETDYSDRYDFLCYSAKAKNDYSNKMSFVLCHPNEWGNAQSQMCIQDVTSDISFKLIICIGIAGGVSDDLKLGDVAVSNTIFDICERQKVTDKGTEYDTEPFQAHEKSCQKLAFFKSHPGLQPQWETWQLKTMMNIDESIKESHLDVNTASRVRDLIRPSAEFHIGSIVSGPVGQSKKLKNSIKNIKRKMLALETESGGVFRVGKKRGIPCLTIRGISDYSDGEKKQHENEFSGVFRRLAAKNAVEFLVANLSENKFFTDAVSQAINGANDPFVEADKINKVVEEITEEIHECLGRYSSEFRAKPKGYHIPVPRVRVDQNQLAKKNILEPDEILASGRPVTLIEIPSNYPEKSLPWIFAEYYIRGLAGGKIVLPIVINYETISPPNKGFSRNLDKRLSGVKDLIDCVFIVHAVSESTRNRVEFFLKEINSIENGHVIIVGTFSELTQLRSATKGYSSCIYTKLMEVSFLSITRFLASNFGLQSAEAETIAYKLRSVFEKYEISTHPSYFASLSMDAISSLVAAHRRSELINIAVQSYLAVSHLLDRGDKKLSVTTRRSFLRDLAYRTEVQKEKVTRSDAIDIANVLSEEMDFDVRGDQFIASLVEAGILESDRAGMILFTLPFIRSYLVAESLIDKEDVAVKYFDFDAFEFDQQSYDIYFEIHHSDAIYERLVEGLSVADRELKERFDPDRKIFLSATLNPKIFRDGQELQRIEKAFSKYAERIDAGVDSSVEKQKYLDVFDKIRIDEKEMRAKIEETGANSDGVELEDLLESASRKLFIGLVTLSAGSEKLNGTDKRNLASLLLSLGVSILSINTNAALALDLESLREEFRDSDAFARIEAKLGAKDARELGQLIDKVWALVELKALANPYITLQNLFAENGAGKLLYKSILESQPEGIGEELFQSIWLLELDPSSGYDQFVSLLKRLPKERFHRTIIAQYLIVKAYWTQTSSESKRLLLRAAEQCVKPFKDYKFDSAKLMETAEQFGDMK